MVDKGRLIKTFTQLVEIDSLSKKERKMADHIKKKLSDMNLEFYEDDAGPKIGGDSGNIVCKIPGERDVPGIMFMAHMDTVEPGIGKKPIVDGDIIKSDGTTVLGSDDLAGVACILESIALIKENNISHGDIYLVFTVAEEGGLFGAKNLDYNKINAKYAFILDDDGEIGTVAIKAPYYHKVEINIKGKSAHAGLAPEQGISAIRIAAKAISQMQHHGRIDSETTCNIGIIKGGNARNIVCDDIYIEGEVRSISPEKLDLYTKEMLESFLLAAEHFGGKVEYSVEKTYMGFSIDEDSDIMKLLKKSANQLGIELRPHITCGGSDTNIVNAIGIQALDISVGMQKVHSTEEQIKISDMVKATELIIALIDCAK